MATRAAKVVLLALTTPLAVSAFSASAFGGPRLRTGAVWGTASCSAVRRAERGSAVLALRAQEKSPDGMTDAERKEYEALMAEARRIQGTFDQMIGGAFGDESPAAQEPDPVQVVPEDGPKGFNIPIEEYDDELTPELETEEFEPLDVESMSPEERAGYEAALKQNEGDAAYEACEAAIAAQDWATAWAQHELCVECYEKSGILSDGSIFKPSFEESLAGQRKRLPEK